MPKIYWYQKQNGIYLDESEDTAWRIHNQYLDPRRGFKYIGWSSGEFITAVRNQNKPVKSDSGIMQDFSEDIKKKIQEAISQEIEFARNNEDKSPPPNRSRKEMISRETASRYNRTPQSVTQPITPGILGRMK